MVEGEDYMQTFGCLFVCMSALCGAYSDQAKGRTTEQMNFDFR
jgi:hypothetical protein